MTKGSQGLAFSEGFGTQFLFAPEKIPTCMYMEGMCTSVQYSLASVKYLLKMAVLEGTKWDRL